MLAKIIARLLHKVADEYMKIDTPDVVSCAEADTEVADQEDDHQIGFGFETGLRTGKIAMSGGKTSARVGH